MQLPTVLLFLAVTTSTTVDAFVVSPGWTKTTTTTTTTSQRYASSSSPVSEEEVLARAAECINDEDSCSAQEIETLFERVRSMENGGWDELGNVEDTLLSQLAMLQTEEAEVEQQQQQPVLLPYLEQLSSASTTVEKQEIVDSMVASVAQSYLDTLHSRQKTMSRNAASSVTDAYLDDCTNEGIKNKTKKRRGLAKGMALTASFLANLGRGGEKPTTTIVTTEPQEAITKDEPAVAAPEIPVTAQAGKFDEILQQAEEEARAANDNDDDNVASEPVSEGSTFTQLIERAAAVTTNDDEDDDTELEDLDGALGLVAGGLLVLAFISQIFH